MEPRDEVFNGIRDRYKGVTVSTASERFDITQFSIKLQSKTIIYNLYKATEEIHLNLFLESLDYWQQRQCRSIWFKVDVGNADVVPILAKVKFIRCKVNWNKI